MELNDLQTETVWGKLFNRGKNELYIGVVYRSPNTDAEEVQELHSIIERASKNHILIIGDFNYPTIDWDLLNTDSAGQSFLDLIQNSYLIQHVHTPTRGTIILDLILSSE